MKTGWMKWMIYRLTWEGWTFNESWCRKSFLKKMRPYLIHAYLKSRSLAECLVAACKFLLCGDRCSLAHTGEESVKLSCPQFNFLSVFLLLNTFTACIFLYHSAMGISRPESTVSHVKMPIFLVSSGKTDEFHIFSTCFTD